MAKSVSVPLGLTEAASADASFQKKKFGSRSYKPRTSGSETHDSRIYGLRTTPLIISNEDMKIVKHVQDSGILMKSVTETTENEAKEKSGCLGMLLGILGASLLGNILADKSVTHAALCVAMTGEGTIRAGENG